MRYPRIIGFAHVYTHHAPPVCAATSIHVQVAPFIWPDATHGIYLLFRKTLDLNWNPNCFTVRTGLMDRAFNINMIAIIMNIFHLITRFINRKTKFLSKKQVLYSKYLVSPDKLSLSVEKPSFSIVKLSLSDILPIRLAIVVYPPMSLRFYKWLQISN